MMKANDNDNVLISIDNFKKYPSDYMEPVNPINTDSQYHAMSPKDKVMSCYTDGNCEGCTEFIIPDINFHVTLDDKIGGSNEGTDKPYTFKEDDFKLSQCDSEGLCPKPYTFKDELKKPCNMSTCRDNCDGYKFAANIWKSNNNKDLVSIRDMTNLDPDKGTMYNKKNSKIYTCNNSISHRCYTEGNCEDCDEYTPNIYKDTYNIISRGKGV